MSDIVKQLRHPPFGTETTERNLMGRAADEIERLHKINAKLDSNCEAAIRKLQAAHRMLMRHGVPCKSSDYVEAIVEEETIEGLKKVIVNASGLTLSCTICSKPIYNGTFIDDGAGQRFAHDTCYKDREAKANEIDFKGAGVAAVAWLDEHPNLLKEVGELLDGKQMTLSISNRDEATVGEGIIAGLEEAVEHASQPDLGPRWSKKS